MRTDSLSGGGFSTGTKVRAASNAAPLPQLCATSHVGALLVELARCAEVGAVRRALKAAGLCATKRVARKLAKVLERMVRDSVVAFEGASEELAAPPPSPESAATTRSPPQLDGGSASESRDRATNKTKVTVALLRALPWPALAAAASDDAGECSFMYRYISRESCSQFDSLPLTSLTRSPTSSSGRCRVRRSGRVDLCVVGRARRRRGRASGDRVAAAERRRSGGRRVRRGARARRARGGDESGAPRAGRAPRTARERGAARGCGSPPRRADGACASRRARR